MEEEYNEALREFQDRYHFYQLTLSRKYKNNRGDMHYAHVESSWNRFLRARKQFKGF
jgi:hypothetical protein